MWAQGYGSPSPNAEQGHCGPEQQPCCREAECQHHLLPGEGPSRKGSIRVKTRWTKCHVSPPSMLSTSIDTTRHRTLRMAPVQDSPLPIPSRLPFTFSQAHWEATRRENTHQATEQHEWTRPALGDTASNTRVSQSLVEDVSYKQFSF